MLESFGRTLRNGPRRFAASGDGLSERRAKRSGVTYPHGHFGVRLLKVQPHWTRLILRCERRDLLQIPENFGPQLAGPEGPEGLEGGRTATIRLTSWSNGRLVPGFGTCSMTVPGTAVENLRTSQISVNPSELSTCLASAKGTPVTLGSVAVFIGTMGVPDTVDAALGVGDEPWSTPAWFKAMISPARPNNVATPVITLGTVCHHDPCLSSAPTITFWFVVDLPSGLF
jgi:hypothetical protein